MRIDTIISRIINFGILVCSVEGLQVGLLSPIEVVEEHGCHDTELRLTCGNLDSKIAILEAEFAPNCTRSECLRFDIERLIQTFSIKETEESKNAERKAGQKFLETLRQNHSNEDDVDLDVIEDVLPGVENAQTNKNISLRMVLERLIIRYLRQLSPEDELDEILLRHRRNTLNESRLHSVEIDSIEHMDSNEEDNVRLQSTRSHCEEQRRQISSLNVLDLHRSYSNQSDNMYNIRKMLNKRCSGKNHCSFIFAVDHPFAKVWKGGIVRIKYICMEDFRINRYCGEQLAIDFEIDPNDQFNGAGRNEPIAQPRIQPRETSLHSLKIIKADDRITTNIMNLSKVYQEPRKIKTTLPIKQLGSESREQKRVYSQDFKVLKILPNNIDDFNDIETAGNEIYFRKENISGIEDDVTDTIVLANSTSNIASNNSYGNIIVNEQKVEENSFNVSAALENITITIREGGHYITVYPNSNKTFKSTPSNIAVDRGKYLLEETHETSNIFQQSSPPTTTAFSIENDQISPTDISTIYNIFNSTDDVDLEIIKEKGLHKVHQNDLNQLKNSRQNKQISYRQPLLHGFAMTPGYPKFYIGEFACYWNIVAPDDIRVRISILDISLRYDNICKDYLQIDDVGSKKTLFNSCTDAVHPIGIISTSNSIRVTIKTTSKFAYPKRGILLHYTADGCINPPIPTNVKLVDRTATTAYYECLPSFLFPDSRHSTRKLTCNNIHVWDKLLPNCIEQEKLFRRAVLSEDKLSLINKKPGLSLVKNKMPSQKDADMIFDIIIPSILITGLFIINGVIFAIIMKFRQRSKALGDREMELAEL